MPTKSNPEGFHAITPYLFAQGASRLIEFIVAAFEGELIFEQKRADGAVMHATMRIRDSMLMLADPTPEFGPMRELNLLVRHRLRQNVPACARLRRYFR